MILGRIDNISAGRDGRSIPRRQKRMSTRIKSQERTVEFIRKVGVFASRGRVIGSEWCFRKINTVTAHRTQTLWSRRWMFT